MTTVQTAQSEAQAAIWQLLNPAGVFDATLTSLGFLGLYDEVREDQAFDYLSFGPTLERPSNYLNHQRGYLCTIQLDIWSRQLGFKAAQQALARCNQLIDQQVLPLPNQKPVYAMYNSSQQLRDPDEFATRHIAVKYDVMTLE